ncbi:MAG: succinate dehydrogenase assembly factor 2 [Pseudomonadota bacterium]
MEAEQSSGLDVRRRRARYRANYRGTKEMDWLLGKFADAHLADMPDDRLTTFEQFLALADPELQVWLMDSVSEVSVAPPDPKFAELIDQVRAFHDMKPLASRG